MTNNQFRKLALSFEGTIEMPHFERRAFKIVNKRIFATLHEASKTANLMFSPANQYVYCRIGNEAIYPVNNKWGLKGATSFDLKKIDRQLMLEALDAAYQEALNSGSKKQKENDWPLVSLCTLCFTSCPLWYKKWSTKNTLNHEGTVGRSRLCEKIINL